MQVVTDRLLIRPWRHEEAPRLRDVLSRLEVAKWHRDAEESALFVMTAERWAQPVR